MIALGLAALAVLVTVAVVSTGSAEKPAELLVTAPSGSGGAGEGGRRRSGSWRAGRCAVQCGVSDGKARSRCRPAVHMIDRRECVGSVKAWLRAVSGGGGRGGRCVERLGQIAHRWCRVGAQHFVQLVAGGGSVRVGVRPWRATDALALACSQTQELVLFKMEPPPKPWSPPENLWMYWGGSPNKRFGHSGDNMRHLVKLGRCCPIPATPPLFRAQVMW